MVSNEVQEKIAKQLEYYFSDFNLVRDKFMKEQIAKDDGWVPFEVLFTFNRLKTLISSNTDEQAVIESIKASATDLIEISEDGKKIRRSPAKPIPEQDEYKEQAMKRTLHIKGFPLESTFDQLWSYCSTLGPLESLQLRKHRKGTFKGCVLAVFKDQVDADRVVGETLKYKEKELLKEKEEAHVERKREFFKNKKNKKQGKLGDEKSPNKETNEKEANKEKSEGAKSQNSEKNGKTDETAGEKVNNDAIKRQHPDETGDAADSNGVNGETTGDFQVKKVKLDKTEPSENTVA